MMEEFFKEGIWQGSGALTLSMFEEKLPLTSRFTIQSDYSDSQEIHFIAEYKVEGYSEILVNSYHFMQFFKMNFRSTLENDSWGKVEGTGFISQQFIGIEYGKNHAGFFGFEAFQFLPDGTLHLRSEFSTGAELRSELDVKMVKKSAPICAWKTT